MSTVTAIVHHLTDAGDDPRDRAIGWLIAHSDDSPDARLGFVSEVRAEVVDGDSVHVFAVA